MKKLFLLPLFLSTCLSTFHLSAQQAWTQKKGAGYFQLGSSLLTYTALHNPSSSITTIPRPITELILSLYGEYGLTDKWMATLVLPYHLVSNGNINPDFTGFVPEKGRLNAIGNINIGLTYKLLSKNNWVVSSKLNMSAKTATLDHLTGLRTGYDAWGIAPTILAGIGTSNYFASFETGFQLLTNNYLPKYTFDAQIGKPLLKTKKLLFVFGVSIRVPVGSATAEESMVLDNTASLTGLYLNQQSYYAATLKWGYQFKKDWSVWVAASGGAATNTGRNAVYYVAVGKKLSWNK